MQSPKSGLKKWINLQSAAIAGSANPLKCLQNPPICWPIHPPLRKNKWLLVAYQRVIMRPL